MRALGLVIILFAADACAQEGSYKTEKIAALGAQIAAKVRQETKQVVNDRVQGYVDDVGQRLSSAASSPFPWHFKVVTGMSYNITREPFSIPGGYIFIPAELITAAESEDEFAGMLAHAMAHAFETVPQMQGENTRLIFTGSWIGGLVPIALLPKQREMELAADAEAVSVMRKAGFHPEALGRYLARVQPEDLGQYSPCRSAVPALPPSKQRLTDYSHKVRTVNSTKFKRNCGRSARLGRNRRFSILKLPSLTVQFDAG